MRRFSAEVPRCRGTVVLRCRGAEVLRCCGGGVPRCAFACRREGSDRLIEALHVVHGLAGVQVGLRLGGCQLDGAAVRLDGRHGLGLGSRRLAGVVQASGRLRVAHDALAQRVVRRRRRGLQQDAKGDEGRGEWLHGADGSAQRHSERAHARGDADGPRARKKTAESRPNANPSVRSSRGGATRAPPCASSCWC